jgi:hypothetical protein
MFALAAAVLFVIAAVRVPGDWPWETWLLLGLAAWSLHQAWPWSLPAPTWYRRPPGT